MNDINLTETRKYLIGLATEAGGILKRYFISGEFTSRSKGGVDFLTQADEEVDQFLLSSIKEKFPENDILTEETAPKDYSPYKKIKNLWVIDPLDGTINFSRGNPHFAISIGLVDKGVSKLGVIYAPLENNLYWAQEDEENAFLNGKPIKISTTADLKEAVIACDWGWKLESRLSVVRWLKNIAAHIRQIKSMGSAVVDLASLASGRVDAYIHSDLKPWDVAASSLLIKKAGGEITTPNDEEWNVFNPEILASNKILHDSILDLINK